MSEKYKFNDPEGIFLVTSTTRSWRAFYFQRVTADVQRRRKVTIANTLDSKQKRMSEKYKFNDPEGIYFVTSTIVDWIDLFTRKEMKHLIVDSLKHCQQTKGLIIHAWCIMPSHLHLIISSSDKPLHDVMRDFKKYTSREVIKLLDELNESRKEWLLQHFEDAGKALKRITKYKVWQDGNQPKQLMSNDFLQQKLDYLHNNPVEDEIVDEAEHYLYSSARDYMGHKGLLKVDLLL